MDQWMLLAFLLVVYLLPSEMAASRGHYQRWTIFWLNLVLGWTVVGWVVALVWAATNPVRPAQIATPTSTPPPTPSVRPAAPVEYERVNVIGPDQCPKCWKPKEGDLPFCRHCGASFS